MCLPRDIHNISLGKEKSTPRINNVSIKIVSLKNYFIFFPFFESLQKSFFQFISSKFLPNLEIAHLLKIDRTGFNSTRRKDIDFPRERKKKERKRRKVKATKNRLSLGLTFSSFVRACRCGSMERETPGDIYNTGSDSWQTRVHHTGRIFLYVSARTVSTCRARARCSRCPSHRMRSADKGYRAMRGKLIPSATGRSCALSRSRIRPNMCTPAARDASRFGI